MKITFLGTGAADWPMEKPAGTAEFRRLSSALVDDVLLIDPGPQVLDAMKELGKDSGNVKYIVNTHRHSDHFCDEVLQKLKINGAEFFELCDGDVKEIGNYTVRAYNANHPTCEKTIHFIISDGNKTLFYGLDGAWLLYDEVQAIKEHKPDFAVLDATIGYVDGDYRIFEHNNLNMVLEMEKTLREYVGRFCISHMAKTLHTDHETLEAAMKKHNIVAAYDGLEINI